jgi:hypothetical protein
MMNIQLGSSRIDSAGTADANSKMASCHGEF